MPALNQAWRYLKDTTDYIFYIHNDVMIYEKNFDDKIVRVIERENNIPGKFKIGVAGFYGAKQIGVSGIYRTPYYINQLVRGENVSACTRMNPAVHGFRPPSGEIEEVAVMDGFSLIVSVDLLNRLEGFDRSYPIHHMYDNDICLESLNSGFRNIVISMDADHLGGRTDVGENWAEPFGKTKQQIHSDAHPIFWEKWKPGKHSVSLPFRVL
jgi:GT2 family glycosyltransferase